MRDYWLTQEILKGIGFAYIALTLIALALALWLPKRWWGKLIAVAVVIGIFSILPRQAQKEIAQDQVKADEFKVRYDKAKALFDERCKTAGEKIYRTVENVEGVLLMKVRPERINFSDQYALDDPYGQYFGGDAYIASFLWGRNKEGKTWEGGTKGGFSYVDTIDSSLKIRYRYTASIRKRNDAGDSVEFLLNRSSSPDPEPRYGITWEDLSTREDRDSWIAGGSIKVIDLKTKEILGERIGYMLDAGQGDKGGERSPWLFAQQNACPEFPTIGSTDPRRRKSSQINRDFIESVLKLKQH